MNELESRYIKLLNSVLNNGKNVVGYVKDISPKKAINGKIYILICESPGKDEVEKEIPLFGDSGKSVYKMLIGGTNESIGNYCATKDTNIGIFNIFNYPMQKKDYGGKVNSLNADDKFYDNIERIRTSEANFKKHRSDFENGIEDEMYNNFKKRLETLLDIDLIKKSTVVYIPCGHFAYKFFYEFAKEKKINPDNIIIMPHPSYGNWDMIETYYNNFKFIYKNVDFIDKK